MPNKRAAEENEFEYSSVSQIFTAGRTGFRIFMKIYSYILAHTPVKMRQLTNEPTFTPVAFTSGSSCKITQTPPNPHKKAAKQIFPLDDANRTPAVTSEIGLNSSPAFCGNTARKSAETDENTRMYAQTEITAEVLFSTADMNDAEKVASCVFIFFVAGIIPSASRNIRPRVAHAANEDKNRDSPILAEAKKLPQTVTVKDSPGQTAQRQSRLASFSEIMFLSYIRRVFFTVTG